MTVSVCKLYTQLVTNKQGVFIYTTEDQPVVSKLTFMVEKGYNLSNFSSKSFPRKENLSLLIIGKTWQMFCLTSVLAQNLAWCFRPNKQDTFPRRLSKTFFLSQLFLGRKEFVPGQLDCKHPVIKDEHSTHDFCFGNFPVCYMFSW